MSTPLSQDRRRERAVAASPRLAGLALGVAIAAVGVRSVLAGGDVPPDPTTLTALTSWTFDPFLQVPLIALTILYLVAIRRIDRAHPATPVPSSRVLAFLLGIATIEVALQSAIGVYDDVFFSVHMVQHMLLIFIAAPLLLMGTPITVLLRAVPPEVRNRRVLPVLHSRVVRLLGHPLVAWMLFTVVIYASHLSPFFELALENDIVHRLEHVLFLGSALLFWWPVIGLDPGPRRLAYPMRALYLALAFPLMTFVALAIFSAPDVLYPHYASLDLGWGPAALDDQQAAAAIMWVWGDLTFLASIILVVAAWLRDEERRTARTEGRVDAERAVIRQREERLAARLAAERAGEGPERG